MDALWTSRSTVIFHCFSDMMSSKVDQSSGVEKTTSDQCLLTVARVPTTSICVNELQPPRDAREIILLKSSTGRLLIGRSEL